MNYATTNLLTVSVTATIIATALIVTVMNDDEKSEFYGNDGTSAAPNLIKNALSSQIKVSLSQVADAAEKAVGNNSHAVAAHLRYLVYTVWFVDSSFNFQSYRRCQKFISAISYTYHVL